MPNPRSSNASSKLRAQVSLYSARMSALNIFTSFSSSTRRTRRFFPSRFAISPHNSNTIAAIWKALAIAPVAVKSPQNETPPSLEIPRDRAGSNRSQGAKSQPPQVSPPPRLLKTGAIATAFQITRPIVRKSLERFLSAARFGRELKLFQCRGFRLARSRRVCR